MSTIDGQFTVLQALGELRNQAKQEAERTDRLATLLAQRITAYYTTLENAGLPANLVHALTLDYHERILRRVEPALAYGIPRSDAVVFVPVPLAESEG